MARHRPTWTGATVNTSVSQLFDENDNHVYANIGLNQHSVREATEWFTRK